MARMPAVSDARPEPGRPPRPTPVAETRAQRRARAGPCRCCRRLATVRPPGRRRRDGRARGPARPQALLADPVLLAPPVWPGPASSSPGAGRPARARPAAAAPRSRSASPGCSRPWPPRATTDEPYLRLVPGGPGSSALGGHVRPPAGAPRRPPAAHRVGRRHLARARRRRPGHDLDAAVAHRRGAPTWRSSASWRSAVAALADLRRRVREGAPVDAAARDAARRRRRGRGAPRSIGARRRRPGRARRASSCAAVSHATRRMLERAAGDRVGCAASCRAPRPRCSCAASSPTASRSPSSADAPSLSRRGPGPRAP